MDPWLERFWLDVHATFIVAARNQLQIQLGPGLVARIQERVYVELEPRQRRRFNPDLHVTEDRPAIRQTGSRGGSAVAEPFIVHLDQPELREPFIEIRDERSGGQVITVVELVSPTNKGGSVGRRKYLRKQEDVLRSRSNLVEIDLIRSGRAVTAVAGEKLPAEQRTPYHACVSRASSRHAIEHYRIPLKEPLPTIKVPLRPGDADATLDLQVALEESYRQGRYDQSIDYDQPPDAPLDADELEWAMQQIQAWRVGTP
jgi:hypothetical protein